MKKSCVTSGVAVVAGSVLVKCGNGYSFSEFIDEVGSEGGIERLWNRAKGEAWPTLEEWYTDGKEAIEDLGLNFDDYKGYIEDNVVAEYIEAEFREQGAELPAEWKNSSEQFADLTIVNGTPHDITLVAKKQQHLLDFGPDAIPRAPENAEPTRMKFRVRFNGEDAHLNQGVAVYTIGATGMFFKLHTYWCAMNLALYRPEGPCLFAEWGSVDEQRFAVYPQGPVKWARDQPMTIMILPRPAEPAPLTRPADGSLSMSYYPEALDYLTIPETSMCVAHDSGSVDPWFASGLAKTQWLDITEQLNQGVRNLDLRVGHLWATDTFIIVHSVVPMALTLGHLLRETIAWLLKHPQEFVFLDFHIGRFDNNVDLANKCRDYVESIIEDYAVDYENVRPFGLSTPWAAIKAGATGRDANRRVIVQWSEGYFGPRKAWMWPRNYQVWFSDAKDANALYQNLENFYGTQPQTNSGTSSAIKQVEPVPDREGVPRNPSVNGPIKAQATSVSILVDAAKEIIGVLHASESIMPKMSTWFGMLSWWTLVTHGMSVNWIPYGSSVCESAAGANLLKSHWKREVSVQNKKKSGQPQP